MIKLEIYDSTNTIRTGRNNQGQDPGPMSSQGDNMVFMTIRGLTYQPGDKIRVTTDAPGQHLVVKLDETLDSSMIYLTGTTWEYTIPLSEGARTSIVDTAFTGKKSYIYARYAKEYEVKRYRNLALNPHDQKEPSGAYPHASANVETRNDSTFFAKNAIDGIYANDDHGPYPYQSWGINRDPNAALTISFGRKVRLDGVGFVLRADFPHDSYWTQVSLRFACGTVHVFDTNKKAEIQEFGFPPIVTDYVVLEKLIKADDESPFPALTQIELYGTEEFC